MKRNFCLSILSCLFLTFGFTSNGQDKTNAENLVNAQEYTFEAQVVIPGSGSSKFLSSGYVLVVAKDKIIADLPYFGRADMPPIDPTDIGINFTSHKFSYILSHQKKHWQISIVPADVMDVRRLQLTIYENGNASLQVLSNSRQPIFFNGVIDANSPKSKDD